MDVVAGGLAMCDDAVAWECVCRLGAPLPSTTNSTGWRSPFQRAVQRWCESVLGVCERFGGAWSV